MALSNDTAARATFSYPELCKSSELEGHGICRLSFEQTFAGLSDLRQAVPGLQRPIHPKDVVVDSDMSLSEAFRNLSPQCPDAVLAKQQLLRVFYFGEDARLHQGQVVVHEALIHDISALFEMVVRTEMPIHSVIPIAHQQFALREYTAPQQYSTTWSDHLSMEANNSSSFNYRRIVTPEGVAKTLSLHALGLAFDINPVWNPCYGEPVFSDTQTFPKEAAAGHRAKLPANGEYDPQHLGTMTGRHPIVQFLKERGWTWGGEWGNPLDYHHFQKVPRELEDEVKALRNS